MKEPLFFCHYIPYDQDPDFLSKCILKYKDKVEKYVCVLNLRSFIKITRENHVFDLVIRILSHNETTSDNTHPLDKLAKALCINYDIQYYPDLLRKKSKTKPFKTLNKDERYKEIKGNYYLDSNILKIINVNKIKKILLLDDIYTTGTSMNIISELLEAKFIKSEVISFAIARTSRAERNIEVTNKLYEIFLNE